MFSNCIEKKKNRGFIFSIDAVLAIVLITYVLLLMNFSINIHQSTTFSRMEIKKNLDFSFQFLDSNGAIKTMNQAHIQGALNSMLPINYNARAIITEYEYFGGNFSQTRIIQIGNFSKDISSKNVVTGKKVFTSFAGNDTNRFYFVKYKGWFKS